MDNVKRAAIYVRVSTVEQDTDPQEHELREYCERRGWSCVVYRDKGQSGAKNDRPALTTMMNDLRRRKIDVIVVWALDRLARSLRQLLSIAEECRAVGVDLVSLKQNVDTTLPAGRLTFQVLGAVAEFEREMLRERVKAGMAQARRSGKHVGRPLSVGSSHFLLTASDALQVHQHRERDDSQDFGTTLIIVLGTTAVNTLAQGIAVWLQRNSGVRINVNKANGELVAEGLDSKDVAEIVKALSSAS